MTKAELIKRLDNFSIFWLTLYGECRGEPIDSQIAHAWVIRNRAIGKAYKDVCLARLQFSCWNDDDPNLAKIIAYTEGHLDGEVDIQIVLQLKWVAEGVTSGLLSDITHGANHYMAEWLWKSPGAPSYKNAATGIMKFGNTVFFSCP